MSAVLFLVLLVGCCGYALLRGGAPERIAAGLQLGAFAINLPLHWMLEAGRYRTTLVGTMTIDLLLLVALFVLAHRSTRFWPLWLTGWQGAAVVAHLAKLLDPSMVPLGYAIQTTLWGYLMLVAMAVGTWRHRARMATGDPDPSWKVLSA